jgi:putative PIN family toxin of toxin-antitoxin system
MRAVLDTNVIISMAIKPTRRLAKELRNGAFTLIISDPILNELIDVLNRPRLRNKYHLTPHYIFAFLQLVRLRCEFFETTEKIEICRDPKDNMFLEVAIVGKANVIVSHDRDLLDLHSFRNIPIIEPIDFIFLLARQT